MKKQHNMIILASVILIMALGMLIVFYSYDKPILDAQSKTAKNLSPDEMVKGTQEFINNTMKNVSPPKLP